MRWKVVVTPAQVSAFVSFVTEGSLPFRQSHAPWRSNLLPMLRPPPPRASAPFGNATEKFGLPPLPEIFLLPFGVPVGRGCTGNEIAIGAAHNVKERTMIIGNFKYDTQADTYAGDVTTLTFQRLNVEFRPTEKSAEREPDYRIVAETGFGTVEFGAAWKRTSEKGQDFLSVSIDDPALAGSLNAALFPSDEDGISVLIWSRPKAKPETKPAKAAPKAKAA